MVITLKKASLGWGLGGLIVSLFALGPSGCSSDSASPSGDASTAVADGAVDDGPAPPLGVPLPSCAGCPVCGGVLGSATTGISYCTKDCTANTDCPTGTACVANTNSPTALDMQCIKTCASNSDCTAPFICRSDLGTPGSYCWSPFPAPEGGMTMNAGNVVPEAGVAETGAPAVEAGTDAGAPADAATIDAGGDASDGG